MNGILLNNENDLSVQNGSLVIGDSTLQNQKILLYASKGELKEVPDRGVGLLGYIEENNSQALCREIDKQFSLDGMKVKRIHVNFPIIETEASYER